MLIELIGVSVVAVALSWLRITLALLISILAAVVVGISAGLNGAIERIVIPLLDVLQSVPILGFFPLALYLFVALSPSIGPELAAIFLIFTSTFWNIAFGVYESIRALPPDVLDMARITEMGLLDQFRFILFPATIPRIVSNLAASIANGFYFLTASEIISFGATGVEVLGIGSLVARFVRDGNMLGVGIGVATLTISIVIISTIVLNPLTSWSAKYRFETSASATPSQPRLATLALSPLRRALVAIRSVLPSLSISIQIPSNFVYIGHMSSQSRRLLLIAVLSILAALITSVLTEYIGGITDVLSSMLDEVARLGPLNVSLAILFSLLRVMTALTLSLAWIIPVAYLLATKEKARTITIPFVQIAASLPAPLFFPLIASAFLSSDIMRELGSIFLILLGTQWYVFYSTLGGFMRVPTEYAEISKVHRLGIVRALTLIYIPFALPSIITGLVTASGGAWNTLIIAERLSLGEKVFATNLPGLGKMLSQSVEAGSLYTVALLVFILTMLVIVFNRLLWKRLYDYALELTRE